MRHRWINKPSTGDGMTHKVNKAVMKHREEKKKKSKSDKKTL